MQGKRGFLRILEAFIAVLIIGGVLAFVYFSEIKQPREDEYVYQIIRTALKEISNNPDSREWVLTASLEEYDRFSLNIVSQKINSIVSEDYVFKYKICELNSACGLGSELPEKNVFSSEVSISSTLSQGFQPRKLRLFVWEK